MNNAPVNHPPLNNQAISPLDPVAVTRFNVALSAIDDVLDSQYPGDRQGAVQPSHTVYVSAADLTETTITDWGTQAVQIATAQEQTLTELVGADVVAKTIERLTTAPIDDLRVDFEDGYGFRGDPTEDAHAQAASRVLTAWAEQGSPTRSYGIRAKGLGRIERARGLRTLEIVVGALAASNALDRFVFTVPKLRHVDQVAAVVDLCAEFERAHGLPAGTIVFELQIESPQAIISAEGTATVAAAIHRSAGRCTGLHYGTYDYSAACGIASAQQSLEHPVADHAKAVMLAAAAQTGVWVSDGSTQVLPVGDSATVEAALRRHFRLVTRSLEGGIYQGWDMHPGHVVTRWAATFAYFQRALPAAATRLQAYLDRQRGNVADEPATAVALASVISRGLQAGAYLIEDVQRVAPTCDTATLADVLARTAGPSTR